ncbi:nucleotide sugar dehydrogenase [Amycolatopsis sp. WAC 01376]|uniref:nucleotide sugar dehydrogenase n=1 Tax=Amycolatopsis sp. WAC 01376 TaxID=2203195 RepID=UPI000F76F3EF|nr:nucleotide sugar dehydrogenase [Amycolatopsis sp. WAC 01376]RSM56217.1 nucleotide sugar dehydrogenase [Amycolatopsis sp. WAC 01376]
MNHPGASPGSGPIAVIGLGYVGLPLALSFARQGRTVVGVESDPEVRSSLAAGRPRFHEAGVAELLREQLGERFTVAAQTPSWPDAVVICVGTAVDPETKRPNLAHLRAAVDDIAPRVDDDTLVVVRSTVPVGTTRKLVRARLRDRGVDPLLAFCPERTIQGRAMAELTELPQVIGAIDERSLARAKELYAPVAPDQVPVSSPEAAELVKLVCNAHTDLIYGFGNEVALIAEALGVDASEVIASANLRYPRPDLCRPGYVGGSCLTKDPYLLAHSAEEAGYHPPMVAAAREVNERVPRAAVQHVLAALATAGRPVNDAKVLVCGVAYKGHPETDDVRGSAAIDVVRLLGGRVAELAGHDYVVGAEPTARIGLTPASLDDGMADADALLVLVDHPRYAREITAEAVRARMRPSATVVDIWGVLEDELGALPDVDYRRLGNGR